MKNQISLSPSEQQELKEFLEDVAVVLARHADQDLKAAQLYRLLLASSAPNTRRREKVFLAGQANAEDGPRLKVDLAGHHIVDYEGASKHCLSCAAVLLAAGDVSVDHESEFAPSAVHDATQRYILKHPGTTYIEALNRIGEGGS